jgi:hypothetical protein
VIEGNTFREETYAAASFRIAEGTTQHLTASAGGAHKAHGEVDGRGLSGSVRPKKAKNLALLDLQREVVEGPNRVAVQEPAIFLGDVFKLEGCGHLKVF